MPGGNWTREEISMYCHISHHDLEMSIHRPQHAGSTYPFPARNSSKRNRSTDVLASGENHDTMPSLKRASSQPRRDRAGAGAGEEESGMHVNYQERRNGAGRLLKTLMMMLSLVTASICGPGNWPLIRIPCSTAGRRRECS